eukprot:UN09991
MLKSSLNLRKDNQTIIYEYPLYLVVILLLHQFFRRKIYFELSNRILFLLAILAHLENSMC